MALSRDEQQLAEDKAAEFRSDHHISIPVWLARPYIRWTKDDLTPIRDAYDGLIGIQDTLKKARQSDGWIINRHAPRGLGLDRAYPEIRPDRKVRRSGVIKHYHGALKLPLPPPKELCPNHSKTYCVECISPWRIYNPKSKPMREHIARDKDHGAYGDHCGVNSDAVHFHQRLQKYNFPPGHGAKRFDMHPLAFRLFDTAEIAFLCLEGCIKSDAVLTEILETDIKASVLSVPSVTLWDVTAANEFYLVAERYLKGRVVIIVPDADWRDPKKPEVSTQSRLCQSHLHRLGIAAHIAAPPYNAWLANDRLKGVDDHLEAEGTLGQLEVIDKEPSPELSRFVRERSSSISQWRRDVATLRELSIHANDEGQLSPTVQAFARIMDTTPSRVTRSLQHLEEMGAIVREKGDLETRRVWIPRKGGSGHYGRQLEWRKPPTITIIPELRAKSVEWSLGERMLRTEHIEGGAPR
jgi:hypothetical protein